MNPELKTFGFLQISTDLEKNGRQKCSTGQRFIFTEVTFYKIHILAVAGPVIQANGRLSFEDDLRCGGMLYCVSQ